MTAKGQNMIKSTFGLLILLCFQSSLSAQSAVSDSTFYSSYSNIIPHFPDIHMGGQYSKPHRTVNETPFYNVRGFENGKLVISGFEFENLPLQYETWHDLLITITPIHRQMVLLNHLKVDQFTLSDGTTFVRKENVSPYFYHRNGFYRQIIKDEIGLYCKHWRELKKRNSIFEEFDKYINKTRYFFEIEGQLKAINKRKDAFDLLNLRKKDLKPLFKEKNVKYKNNPDRYLGIMVEMANQITNE